MPKASENQHDTTNYSFRLKCLAAITAGAVIAAGITVGIMAAIAANHTVIVVAAATSKALAVAALATTASVAVNILLPVLGAILLIGVISWLAYSCYASNRSSTTYVTAPSRPYSSWWSSGPSFWSPFFSGRNQPSFNHHGHSSSTPFRNAPTEHQHGHSGSAFFENAPTGHQHGHSGSAFFENAPTGHQHGHSGPASHQGHSAVHGH